jgi:hypothetical protein
MSDKPSHNLSQSSDSVADNEGRLWPGKDYHRQVEKLRQHIGKNIYLCELKITDINAAIHHTDRAYRLLAVIDFPQPDPKSSLYPHNILLDDGRGINLGRIASISIGQAFSPAPENVLYQDRTLINNLLPGKQRVSVKSIQQTSRRLLAGILAHSRRPGINRQPEASKKLSPQMNANKRK